MTESASTPRLRITFAIYLALIGATAFIGPKQLAGWHHHAMSAAGFVLVCLSCLGRVWCSVFIAGHKDAQLVTTGPYARCRHPLYACSMVGALGLGLASKSWLLCLITVLLIAALLMYAASCEEQFLADAFPEQFKAYLAATPNMWWPTAAQPLPPHLEVRPDLYWKAFLDAGSFFLLWLLISATAQWRLAS